MSYILEALKKSDKERQRDEIPDLQADHSLPPIRRKERKAPFWRFRGAVILVVFCVVAFLGWQLISAQKLKPADVALPAAIPVVAPVQEVQTPQKQQLPVQSVALSPEIKKQISKEVDAAVTQAATVPDLPPVAAPEKKSAPVKSLAVAPSPQRKSSEPVPPLLEELPVVIRARIPDLSFAGHVYSEVAMKRLIIINNRIVREGDRIAKGLSLEQIDPDGVVLRFEHAVFRVKLF